MATSIVQVVDYFGLQKHTGAGTSWNIDCPFCGKAKKMNVNYERNLWVCPHCHRGGHATDLYTMITRGQMFKDIPDKSELGKEMRKALGEDRDVSSLIKPSDEILTPPQSDSYLNGIYSKLLDIDFLALTEEDKANLLKRGLREEDIQKNGYRSFYRTIISNFIPEDLKTKCREEKWRELMQHDKELKKLKLNQFLCMLTLGRILAKNVKDYSGIPGAFIFKANGHSYPGFRFYDGIMIPVRNAKGEIVSLQVRTQYKTAKYLCLSSSGYPRGCAGTTRIHHPLVNSQPERESMTEGVLIEGPLKADVYAALSTSRPKIYAMIGINATKGLIDELWEDHIDTLYEFMDMDKLTNVNVMAGVRKLKSLCKENGLKVISCFWDDDGVERKWAEIVEYATSNGMEFPPNFLDGSTIQSCIARSVLKLSEEGLKFPHDWYSGTKGIDDYLLSQHNQ